MVSAIFYVIIFVFGLIIGSFLNCVIYRLRNGKGLGGRSFCPKCKHQLGIWDLIPVVSFLALRGKCRYCREGISWQYPAVEIATGALLILNFKFLILNETLILNFETGVMFAYLIAITSALIVIFVYDLKTYLIPDKVVFPAIAVSFLFGLLFQVSSFKLHILAAIIAAGFFFIIWAMSRGKWMGFGDVKLALLLGLFLGWPNILVGLFLSFFIGAIIGVGLIFAQKKKLKSQVPFGPFLVTGAFIALFWGQTIIDWYLGLV